MEQENKMNEGETVSMTENTEVKPAVSPKANYATPVSIIVAALIIALAIVYTHFAPTPQGGNNAAAVAPSVDIKKVNIAGDPYIGNPNAPVTIAYWSDYQCPFCKQFEETTLMELKSTYVDTGKVKVVFKDFQFLGEDSLTAALYARAVWELYPSEYFAWRIAIFSKQDDEGDQGFGDEASVKVVTATIPGIDAAKVSQQVTAKKEAYQKEIAADRQEGGTFGVQGTPGFIVGKKLIPGVAALSVFSPLIDEQLK